MPSKLWEQQGHPSQSRHRLSGVKAPESGAGLWCKQVAGAMFVSQNKWKPLPPCIPGSRKCLCQGLCAAEVRKEIAHLFINTNELVVFKNKILGVFKTTI